jgi:hypothetical protein
MRSCERRRREVRSRLVVIGVFLIVISAVGLWYVPPAQKTQFGLCIWGQIVGLVMVWMGRARHGM